MNIVWSQYAIEDRFQIFEYISQENPIAAIDCDEEIGKQVNSLIRYRDIGRTGRVAGTRGLVIRTTPFIAAYKVEQQKIRILRGLHVSRMWPGGF